MATARKRRAVVHDEQRIRAEDELCHYVQLLIAEVMADLDLTQRQLAKRLGVSDARVGQFFMPGRNITVRTLAAVMHALGQRVVIGTDARNKPS